MRPLIFIFAVFLGLNASGEDFYSDFSQLSRYYQEGIDFRIHIRNTGSKVVVVAPHGGRIELGTSEIADQVAEDVFNLYLFEGIMPSENRKLHLTGGHFDEPKALALVKASTVAISIHGNKDDLVEGVCIGGLNHSLASQIAFSLAAQGFKTEFPCWQFRGDSMKNIVNRAKNRGVQIEISAKLRRNLLGNSLKLKVFSRAIQDPVKNLL